jgi:signal transduction histidine kinase
VDLAIDWGRSKMHAFTWARLRLTMWFVLIVALISVSFSALMYREYSLELERGFRMAELRFRILLEDELLSAQNALKLRLMMVNGIILGTTAVAGFFLAGKALAPIEVIMEEQKRFTSDASHELRTPLTTLKSEIEVALRDKQLTLSEAKTLLQSNLEEVDKMQNLTNYLLALSRYEKSQSIIKRKIDIAEIAERVVRKYKERVVATLKPTILQANEVSIEELLTILLENAVKYTPSSGSIHLSVAPRGRMGEIKVSDTGVGIPRSQIPHVFDRFFRADTSRSTSGYGLGLSIAKSIVDAHEGTIRVQSRLSKGTTFTALLPRKV